MLKWRYDMTPDEYRTLLKSQGGGCAMCGRTPDKQKRSLHVDHDHKTGKVRGILCSRCNRIMALYDNGWFARCREYVRNAKTAA